MAVSEGLPAADLLEALSVTETSGPIRLDLVRPQSSYNGIEWCFRKVVHFTLRYVKMNSATSR
jgi:hypothetical protein